MLAEQDLPPLWQAPTPMGHNGGPVLDDRPPGRPTISTPELRGRILDLLGNGVPLRVICRTTGMPSRRSIYRWRETDAAFDQACRVMQVEGYRYLAETVFEEVERLLDRRGLVIARWVFHYRCQQLARMNPKYFGGRDLKV